MLLCMLQLIMPHIIIFFILNWAFFSPVEIGNRAGECCLQGDLRNKMMHQIKCFKKRNMMCIILNTGVYSSVAESVCIYFLIPPCQMPSAVGAL